MFETMDLLRNFANIYEEIKSYQKATSKKGIINNLTIFIAMNFEVFLSIA